MLTPFFRPPKGLPAIDKITQQTHADRREAKGKPPRPRSNWASPPPQIENGPREPASVPPWAVVGRIVAQPVKQGNHPSNLLHVTLMSNIL